MSGLAQVLKVEWMKVRYYRTFWILLSLFLAAVPVLCLAYAGLNERVTQVMERANPLAFPQVVETVAWLTSFVTPVLGILLIILMTNEREFRTLRQNVIDGWGREQTAAAKFGVMLCMVGLITALVAAISFAVGSRHGGSPGAETWQFLGLSVVQSLAYLAFALFLGTFLKRSGIAIALYVFYAYMGESMLATILDMNVMAHAGAYLPFEATDRLVAGEFRMIRRAMAEDSPPPSDTVYLAIVAGYIAVFSFLSWWRTRHMDL